MWLGHIFNALGIESMLGMTAFGVLATLALVGVCAGFGWFAINVLGWSDKPMADDIVTKFDK